MKSKTKECEMCKNLKKGLYQSGIGIQSERRRNMKKLAEYKSPETLFNKFTREEVWLNESDNTRYYIGIEGRWVYPLYSRTGTDEYAETSTTIAKVAGENIEPMEVRSIEHVERRIKERCNHE